MMKTDSWLDKWLPLLRQKSSNGIILEMGCGNGRDTVDILGTGCKVITSDLLIENLAECAVSLSHAILLQMDNGKPLPFADHSISVIVASLSLHYFTWAVTMQIASELKRCIKTDGILLIRLNSTNDVNHGAGSGLEIEPNFYQVRSRTKRFFNETAMQTFLNGWDIQFLEENVIHRFEKLKSVWEVMAYRK